MSFGEIFCQDRAVEILLKAFVIDRTSHAYIFAGPEGVGKFKTAGEWAKLLLCSEPVIRENTADSCGLCESCRLFTAGSHPDFIHIYKELREFTEDGRGKGPPVDMPIDVIREFLIAKASLRPGISHRKVFVISEAEKLNVHSQNSLLKILEEPPAHCCIILLCTRLDALLPTTRSRCQVVRFGPVSSERIIQKLLELGLDEVRCGYFARMSQGSIGLAVQWAQLEQAGANLFQIKQQLIKELGNCHFSDVPDFAEDLVKKSKTIADVWTDIEENKSRSDLSRRASRNLLMVVISALYDAGRVGIYPDQKMVNFDQYNNIRKLAERFDRETCTRKIEDCYKMLHWVESNVNERLIWEHLLLNLAFSDRINIL